MILTPIILSHIYKLSSYFEKEFYESDVITPIGRKEHIIIVGFSILGRNVASELLERGTNFIIISDNLKHVLLARTKGYMAYFGHLNKRPVLESLAVDAAKAIIITVSSQQNKRLIAQAVLEFCKNANIIVKVEGTEERKNLKDIRELAFVDASYEISKLLVNYALKE